MIILLEIQRELKISMSNFTGNEIMKFPITTQKFLLPFKKNIKKILCLLYKYIISYNSNIKKSKDENYISSDIIKFMKKFICTHKENINIDSLNQ